MGLDLANYDALARKGVQQFWAGRSKALSDDKAEHSQGGERANVLAGKNMDGFLEMISGLVAKNGLADAMIYTTGRPNLTLPGYFRPTKLWDVIVMDGERLVAAIELKSHVGSFGNNFNNRTEEAIGTACDLSTGIREGILNNQSAPFLGWLILVEDNEDSRRPTQLTSKHFEVQPEFIAPQEQPVANTKKKAPKPQLVGYLERYEILCRRLMQERLYDRACVMPSPRSAAEDGAYGEMSDTTNLKSFVAGVAGHVAAWAAQR
ncbi:MAG: PaeR7I family type II restriction endonuclease [Rhodanobacter sp.]